MKKLIPFLILSVMFVLVGTMAFVPASSTSQPGLAAPFSLEHQFRAEPTITGTDKQAPFVDWVLPATNGEIYQIEGGMVELAADAQDNIAVEKVQFYRWDAAEAKYVDIGFSYLPPYKRDLDTSSLNKEWNQVFVQAFDIAGNASERQHIWLHLVEPVPTVPVYLPYLSRDVTVFTLP